MRRRYVHASLRAQVEAQMKMASEPGPELEKDSMPQWRA